MTVKHLPGQHNQLAHGVKGIKKVSFAPSVEKNFTESWQSAGLKTTPTEFLETVNDNAYGVTVRPDGTSSVDDTWFDALITDETEANFCLTRTNKPDFYIAISSRIGGLYPVREDVLRFTSVQSKNILRFFKFLERKAADMGIKQVVTSSTAIPIMLAAALDYSLPKGTGNVNKDVLLMDTMDNLAKRAQDYLNEEYGLAPVNGYKLSGHVPLFNSKIRDILKVKHPRFPEVPLFDEYLSTQHLSDDSESFMLVKDL